MKTTDALKDFVEKDGRKFAEIEREFSWSKSTLSRIITRGQPFRDPILSSVQEVLRSKGYILNEIKDLPKYILDLRELIFLKKGMTIKELMDKLGYLDISTIYSIFRGKKSAVLKIGLIQEILNSNTKEKPKQKILETKESKKSQKEPEFIPVIDDEKSATTYINFAIFLILKHGEEFLQKSNKEGRVKFRKALGQTRLFDATRIMSALNSEKAYERKTGESQCID